MLKKKKKWLFILFVIVVLSSSILILSIMLINMTNTAASLAKSLINKTTDEANIELDKYFETMKVNPKIGQELCDNGVFDAENFKTIDAYIFPTFNNIPSLNTFLVADTLQLQYSGAYNPLLIIRNEELINLKADKQPVAINIKEKEFTNHLFQLEPNDVLYSFSDGYVDQFGGSEGKKFMIKNFRNLLLEIHKKPFDIQKEILDKTLIEWLKNYPQLDDVLVIGIKV